MILLGSEVRVHCPVLRLEHSIECVNPKPGLPVAMMRVLVVLEKVRARHHAEIERETRMLRLVWEGEVVALMAKKLQKLADLQLAWAIVASSGGRLSPEGVGSIARGAWEPWWTPTAGNNTQISNEREEPSQRGTE